MKQNEAKQRMDDFRKFLLSRNPSDTFVDKYIGYARSSMIMKATFKIASTNSIFEVTHLDTLDKIYNTVKCEPSNIRLHNIYSGIISAYIKFLNGQELRKRVVLNKNEKK